MRTIAYTLVALIALVAVAHIYAIGTESESSEVAQYPDGRTVSVETYVRQNISELSPVKEVLGGKFYVTEISVGDGYGTVAYEDGHIALVADFTYEIYSDVGIRITSFAVRQ